MVTVLHSDDQLLRAEVDLATTVERSPAAPLPGLPTDLPSDLVDALDVRPGDRVLEIGPGDLTALLRDAADREPTVVGAAAAEGHTAGAPYDRIIATCAVPRLPLAWLDQCAPGGLIVAPVGGAVARLTKRHDGRAAGRFLHHQAAFPPLHRDPAPAPAAPDPQARRRTTELDARALDHPGFAFWAGLRLAPTITRSGHTLHDPTSGSTARPDGPAAVALSGPRDVWCLVEAAHRNWLAHNRPRPEWFAVEAGPEAQYAAYTAPNGTTTRWVL
ncbi:hypothetical protein [Streptomyces sp. 1331.2]|uniref:hypothetical protein n=1 Tax=Streptomyces sp. 1331.2 TaxID=1938835 RepID=UPI000BCB0DE1|nr:hypothetical protein [Streptomyces sp. 1331.2]SOB82844.1 Protein-L-isoaspartate(D-aspartate) O-methyltransferase (PCMT) [Streptomyces sp. 1331.2]